MDDILSTHPARDTFDLGPLRAAIDAANRCASTCATCSDACLHSGDATSMSRCIDLDNQCAAICRTTADILSRPGPNGDSWRAVVEACIAEVTATGRTGRSGKKNPGTVSELMFTKRGTPHRTAASSTLKVDIRLFENTV